MVLVDLSRPCGELARHFGVPLLFDDDFVDALLQRDVRRLARPRRRWFGYRRCQGGGVLRGETGAMPRRHRRFFAIRFYHREHLSQLSPSLLLDRFLLLLQSFGLLTRPFGLFEGLPRFLRIPHCYCSRLIFLPFGLRLPNLLCPLLLFFLLRRPLLFLLCRRLPLLCCRLLALPLLPFLRRCFLRLLLLLPDLLLLLHARLLVG